MDRRKFIRSGASFGAAALAGKAETVVSSDVRQPGSQQPARNGSPNILIFMPDQQNGATILPGGPVLKPHMDKFRAQATTFSKAHCPAPHCCPSRASFLSGLYPSEHGVFNNVTTETAINTRPYSGTAWWPQQLKAAGYSLGYAGKLHVGRELKPEACGFETLSPLEQAAAYNPNAKVEQWKRARQQKADPATRKPGEILRPDWINDQMYSTTPNRGPKGYEGQDDYRIVQAGIAGMKRMAVSEKPWCVMISNSGSHDPYHAPQRFVEMYAEADIKLPESFADTLEDKPNVYARQRLQYWAQMSEEETKDCLRHYYARCTMQDEMFGELLQALEDTGQADNTIVLYTSDHGDYAGAHGMWMKGVPSFQEAYHIPAVVRWPASTSEPGRNVDAFVDQVDWAPTLLEACGLQFEQPFSGSSLMPWLTNTPPAKWRTSTCTQMNGVELYYTQRIVTTREWKYVYNGFDWDELYDLKNDPHEMKNLVHPSRETCRQVLSGSKGLKRAGNLPFPPLPEALEQVRKDMLQRMWDFAAEHGDTIFNDYGTVALAPYGPGLGAVEPRISRENRRS